MCPPISIQPMSKRTVKTGRNESCPCGSGRKYKKCCYLTTAMRSQADVEQPATIVVSPTLLMNRVEREATLVAKSFDAITGDAVTHLEDMYGRTSALLVAQLQFGEWPADSVQSTCGVVLTNALKSLTAAFSLLRTGWRLQPQLCVRNSMEAAGVVLHLIQRPQDLQAFLEERLDSAKTVSSAKTAFRPFGHLYGILSKQFVHVGKPFRYVQKGNVYTGSEWEMWQCLSGISGLALLLYMATEALFAEQIPEPLFWVRKDEGRLEERQSGVIEEWRREFVRIYKPHVPDAIL